MEGLINAPTARPTSPVAAPVPDPTVEVFEPLPERRPWVPMLAVAVAVLTVAAAVVWFMRGGTDPSSIATATDPPTTAFGTTTITRAKDTPKAPSKTPVTYGTSGTGTTSSVAGNGNATGNGNGTDTSAPAATTGPPPSTAGPALNAALDLSDPEPKVHDKETVVITVTDHNGQPLAGVTPDVTLRTSGGEQGLRPPPTGDDGRTSFTFQIPGPGKKGKGGSGSMTVVANITAGGSTTSVEKTVTW